MFKGLSLEQAPPFEAPLLFFLTAPFFAILAAIFIPFSTFFEENIAILHLFSLGFMLNIMFGSLQQMLPVVVGVKFDNPKKFSKIIYFPLNLGILLFFLTLFFKLNLNLIAATMLFFSILVFATATLIKLFNSLYSSYVIWAIRLSLISLILTLLLGVYMLLTLKNPHDMFGYILPIHAMLGGFGWIGLLIIGISYQVIPMFYVTTNFNEKLKKALPWLIFLILITILSTPFLIFLGKNAVINFILSATFSFFLFLVLNGLFFIFSTITLIKLYKRKRGIKEPSIAFWQFGLILLLIASIYPLSSFFNHFNQSSYAIFFGYGFAISIIYAMLYKIVPFLAWFHISSRGFFDMPTMKEMIDEKFAYIHLLFHILATITLIFSPKIAAIFIIIENIIFLLTIKAPIKIYFEYKQKPSPFSQFQ